jgi:hypothetical protein
MAITTTLGAMHCPHYSMVPKDFEANLRFRQKVLRSAAEDPAVAREYRQMCAEDLMFYVNTFCWTYDPRQAKHPILPFITYGFQDTGMLGMADCVAQGEDFTAPKSRCMGASWMGLTVFEWYWHFQNDLSFLLISRNEKYVDESGNPKALFWKIDFLHKYQPRWLLPTGRWLLDKDPGRRLLHLENADTNSVIDGESTTGDAGRGDRRTAMFIDEHAAFEVNDGFKVLRASRDTANCRGFNSTPQGAANAFYEVCHKTAARQIRMHWSEHPVYNQGLYRCDASGEVELLDDFRGEVTVFRKGVTAEESKAVKFPEEYPFVRNTKPGKLRSPWYDNQCARCVTDMEIAQELDIDFLGSDYQFFDPDTINLLLAKWVRLPCWVGKIHMNPMTGELDRLEEDFDGPLWMWIPLGHKNRVAPDRKFVVAGDVSAGTGASNSVLTIADEKTGQKVGVYRRPDIRPEPFADVAIELCKWFNNAFLIWDASGPTGKTFTMRVKHRGYGNVYFPTYEKKIGRKLKDEPGYYLNPEARTFVLERYRQALGDQTFENPSELGLKECLQFIVQPGGMAEHSSSANSQDPSGARAAHGDETIADALANHGLKERIPAIKKTEPEQPVNCLAWRRQQRELAMAGSASELGEGW